MTTTLHESRNARSFEIVATGYATRRTPWPLPFVTGSIPSAHGVGRHPNGSVGSPARRISRSRGSRSACSSRTSVQPDSSGYERLKWTHGLLRVMESVRAAGHEDRLGDLYTEYGRRIHHDGERNWDPALALETVGLDPSHAPAADDEAWDIPLLERMNEGLALVGAEVGTPIIAFHRPDGREVATFGPVITKSTRPTTTHLHYGTPSSRSRRSRSSGRSSAPEPSHPTSATRPEVHGAPIVRSTR